MKVRTFNTRVRDVRLGDDNNDETSIVTTQCVIIPITVIRPDSSPHQRWCPLTSQTGRSNQVVPNTHAVLNLLVFGENLLVNDLKLKCYTEHASRITIVKIID